MSESLTKQEFFSILAIVSIGFGGLLGIDIHLSSMPSIMSYFKTDKGHMQQSISLFLLGLASSQLIYGPLSDKFGRKPVVLFGIFLASSASFAACFANSIEVFLFLRFLQGAGSSACMGLGRTMIADILQGDRLSTVGSYFTTILAFSPLLAPSVGGYLEFYYGWQANFFVLGSYILLAGIFFFLACPETNKHIQEEPLKFKAIFKTYLSLFQKKLFIGCCLVAGVAMAANIAYATISPFIFQTEYHLTAIQYGWVTAFAGLGALVGKLFNPIFVNRIGGMYTLKFGIYLLSVAFAWLLVSRLLNLEWISLIIFGVFIAILSQSLISPNAMSYGLSPFHTRRGAASAVYGSLMLLVSFSVSSIVSIFNEYGLIVLTICYGILAIASLIIFYLMINVQE